MRLVFANLARVAAAEFAEGARSRAMTRTRAVQGAAVKAAEISILHPGCPTCEAFKSISVPWPLACLSPTALLSHLGVPAAITFSCSEAHTKSMLQKQCL